MYIDISKIKICNIDLLTAKKNFFRTYFYYFSARIVKITAVVRNNIRDTNLTSHCFLKLLSYKYIFWPVFTFKEFIKVITYDIKCK